MLHAPISETRHSAGRAVGTTSSDRTLSQPVAGSLFYPCSSQITAQAPRSAQAAAVLDTSRRSRTSGASWASWSFTAADPTGRVFRRASGRHSSRHRMLTLFSRILHRLLHARPVLGGTSRGACRGSAALAVARPALSRFKGFAGVVFHRLLHAGSLTWGVVLMGRGFG